MWHCAVVSSKSNTLYTYTQSIKLPRPFSQASRDAKVFLATCCLKLKKLFIKNQEFHVNRCSFTKQQSLVDEKIVQLPIAPQIINHFCKNSKVYQKMFFTKQIKFKFKSSLLVLYIYWVQQWTECLNKRAMGKIKYKLRKRGNFELKVDETRISLKSNNNYWWQSTIAIIIII